MRVLIIDDDAAFKKIVERRLRSFLEGLDLTHYPSLQEARTALAPLRQSQSMAFDLVILDQHLPDGRGTDLLNEGWFEDLAVLSISSDPSPEIPGKSIKSGATYFLPKPSVSEPLFQHLVCGLIDRNRLQREVAAARREREAAETVRTLVATLQHEINNPLGAVLGAAYLLQLTADASSDQKRAAELVESSGRRIKHVLDQLCDTLALAPVSKAKHQVFHIPGDKPWDDTLKEK